MTAKQPLSVTHPELAKQAVGWDPSRVTYGSHQKRDWMCELGHFFEASISKRAIGQGCSICAGKTILVGFNDLKTIDPELANQANGWDPRTVTSGSGRKRSWKCPSGHIWDSKIVDRRSGKGCPVCVGQQIAIGFNDLRTTHPQLAGEAYGWDPTSVSKGTNKKRVWKCKLGHMWSAPVSSRSLGIGCPTCAGKIVLLGFNDLATTNPQVAAEAYGWDAGTVTKSSSFKKTWRCELGHFWDIAVASRTTGTGCPTCAGKRVLIGFNDLASSDPEIAAQADGWDPRTITRASSLSKVWKCSQGHSWQVAVSHRTNGNDCPICAGQKILFGFNDLATTNPELSSQAYGWDPKTVSRGTNVKKGWKCVQGHIWFATVDKRSSGRGCPTCAKYGFDPNSEGWLYFLAHPWWEMLQIGITNFPDDRLKSHKKLGWELIELRGPMDGLIAREWETSILRMLKRHGAKLAPETVAGKFDGYTEAWLTQSHQAKSLRELMDTVEKDEDK